jgi:hypothetical protein
VWCHPCRSLTAVRRILRAYPSSLFGYADTFLRQRKQINIAPAGRSLSRSPGDRQAGEGAMGGGVAVFDELRRVRRRAERVAVEVFAGWKGRLVVLARDVLEESIDEACSCSASCAFGARTTTLCVVTSEVPVRRIRKQRTPLDLAQRRHQTWLRTSGAFTIIPIQQVVPRRGCRYAIDQ